jgi:hypothetical protein
MDSGCDNLVKIMTRNAAAKCQIHLQKAESGVRGLVFPKSEPILLSIIRSERSCLSGASSLNIGIGFENN